MGEAGERERRRPWRGGSRSAPLQPAAPPTPLPAAPPRDVSGRKVAAGVFGARSNREGRLELPLVPFAVFLPAKVWPAVQRHTHAVPGVSIARCCALGVRLAPGRASRRRRGVHPHSHQTPYSGAASAPLPQSARALLYSSLQCPAGAVVAGRGAPVSHHRTTPLGATQSGHIGAARPRWRQAGVSLRRQHH